MAICKRGRGFEVGTTLEYRETNPGSGQSGTGTAGLLACVASVSVEQRAKKRDFWRFSRAKNGAKAKIFRAFFARETLATQATGLRVRHAHHSDTLPP